MGPDLMRILFVSSWFPYPPDNGSRIRVFNLLRQLARRHQVTLVSFTQSDFDPERVAGLEPYCQAVYVVPGKRFRPRSVKALLGFLSPYPRNVVDTYSPEMQRQVNALLADGRWDVAIASELTTAPYLIAARLPRILEDLEVLVLHEQPMQSSSRFHRWRYRLTWLKFRRYVAGLVRQFDACTVVSDKERALVAQVVPDGRIDVIPNGLDLSDYAGSFGPPEPDTLIFTGVLAYHANYDALQFFLAEVWPRVRAQRPNARLRVTGRLDGIALGGLAVDANVEFTGYLPDIRPAVAASWLSIAPLRVGGGTRLKILESMALGTPVVATSKGAEGLDVTSGRDILLADAPDEFVESVLCLLDAPQLRERLATNGRQIVAEKYDWNQIGQRFNALVEQVARK